jgi:hypothetical protein
LGYYMSAPEKTEKLGKRKERVVEEPVESLLKR